MRGRGLTKFGFIISLCLIGVVSSHGQNIEIRGELRDALSQEPIVGATIQTSETGVVSDLNGSFIIATDVSDSLEIIVKYVGYQTHRQWISLDEGSVQLPVIYMEVEATLINEVTVTTGKFEKPLSDAVVSIEILRPALLEQTNTTSIDDVLDKVPGVAIIDGQANIRGGSGFSYGAGSRVMLLLDDIPALQADAGFPTWDDFPVENIAQMEIVKGASSSLYGSSALNGVINVRTGYATEDPSTKISIFGTTYFAPKDKVKKWWDNAPVNYGFSVRDARRLGKLDLVNSLYFLDGDEFAFENYDRHRRFTTKMRWRPNPMLELGIQANINDGGGQSFFFWKDAEAGAYQGDSSNYSTSDFTRYFIDPYVKIFTESGDRHEFKARIFDVTNRNNANRSNESTVYYGEYQYLDRMPRWNAVLTAGLVGIHTDVNAELYGDTAFSSNNFAAYLQLEKKIADRLTLSAGLRFEQNILDAPSQVGSVRIPEETLKESKPVFRLGANYHLAAGTFIRGSWGQGYRYPTIAERYITTTFGTTLISPNVNLTSETGWSGELGLKQGFKKGTFQGLADLAFYWSEYQDMMEFVFTGLIEGFQSQNIGDTRIRGVDFSLTGRGNIGKLNTNLLAGYTYVDPVFKEFTQRDSLASSADFNILKYRSKHQFKVDFQAGYKKAKVGFSVLRTSEMVAIDAIFALFVPGLNEFRASHKGFTLVDFRTIYDLNDNWSITLLLKNLFNSEYSVRPGLLEAPRNITLRLNASL